MTALLGFAAASSLAAVAGRLATRRAMASWYDSLDKPPFQPPDWVFAPVWTMLYGAITISGWRVYRARPGGLRARALSLWAAQLVLNAAWSWLFFARRRPGLAFVDCSLLLATAGAYSHVAGAVDKTAARLFVPYVAWLGFAAVLNAELVRRNRS